MFSLRLHKHINFRSISSSARSTQAFNFFFSFFLQIIGGFQSFTEYVVSIRAVNDMNLTGPAVSFSVLTDEAGNEFIVALLIPV